MSGRRAKAPLVTVVTSTYNWPEALRCAMETVLAQTFADFEYLVIGDACTDETEDVVRSFDDPRIVWRNLDANSGNQSVVNRCALETARGKLIAYLNHDDLWFPDHLETVVPALRAGRFDVVNSLCIDISPRGHHFRAVSGLPRKTPSGSLFMYPLTTTVLHTAEAARAAGGWRDWRETPEVPTQEFFARLRALRGSYAVVPHITALKFHSGDRRNSYRLKTADEQRACLHRMRSEPDLRYRELMTAMACELLAESPMKLAQPPRPEKLPAGWQIEQWRRMRGLHPMLDLGEAEPPRTPLPKPDPSHVRVSPSRGMLILPEARRPALAAQAHPGDPETSGTSSKPAGKRARQTSRTRPCS